MAHRLVGFLAAFCLLGTSAARPAGSSALPQAGASQAPATPPRPAYTVDVRLVEVDASVTDAAGIPVRDLKKEDFQVLEDGRPQRIDSFTLVDLPAERAEPPTSSTAPVESDVSTNVQPSEGRLYVLLLDDLHTAAQRSAIVKAAARRFVEQNLGPSDLAAVMHLGMGAQAGQEFTADRRRLLASIDRFVGRKAGSETLDKTEDYNRQVLLTGRTPTRITDAEAPSRGDAARIVLDTIAEVSRALASASGRRKALLWFGEGINYDLLQGVGVPGRARMAFGEAARANLAIYGIDARGLRGLGDEFVQLSSSPADPTAGLGASGLPAELLREQENLRLVANATGGFAVVNAGDFEGAFERVVRDNSTYYVLGYYSTNERRDGTFRRIEVRVNRANVEVRARKGYVAPGGATRDGDAEESTAASPSTILRELLASPLPRRSLPMAAQAVPFRGSGTTGSILLTIQFGADGFRSVSPPSADDKLDVWVAAIDPAGKVQGGDQTSIGLQVRPETREAMATHGFRTLGRLDLPAGRYQLRIASLASGTGKVGSVSCDLEVPDFSASVLDMSGLLLTSAMSALTPTAGGQDERLRGRLPAPPTTVRAFRDGDAIAVLAEVYDRATSTPHRLDIVTTVRNDEGGLVFEDADQRMSDELERLGGAHTHTAEIPLASFRPGMYVVRVEARSSLPEATGPVAREVAFAVFASGATDAMSADAATPSLVTVVGGAVSGERQPRQVVARSEAEWQALWSALPVRRVAPRVTFDDTMIVALFLGARPTAGYAVDIAGARTEGDTLVIEYVERAPSEEGNPPAETTPYVVVGVPRHDGPVRFERIQ